MSTGLSPEQRSLRARGAAYAMHARHDPKQTTQAARDAAFAKYLAEVDPRGELDDTERMRRAVALRKSRMAMLALASAKARARRSQT